MEINLDIFKKRVLGRKSFILVLRVVNSHAHIPSLRTSIPRLNCLFYAGIEPKALCSQWLWCVGLYHSAFRKVTLSPMLKIKGVFHKICMCYDWRPKPLNWFRYYLVRNVNTKYSRQIVVVEKAKDGFTAITTHLVDRAACKSKLQSKTFPLYQHFKQLLR